MSASSAANDIGGGARKVIGDFNGSLRVPTFSLRVSTSSANSVSELGSSTML